MNISKAYVINLDRRPDRMKLFDEEADRAWLNYERVSAIDGGAEGCTQSHLKVCRMAKSAKIDSYLVLEDDAVFVEGFPEKFSLLLEQVPDDSFDLILLGGNYGFFTKYSEHLVRIQDSLATHAMVINSTFYDTFIETLSNTKEPCDVALNKIYKNHKVYGCNPVLVSQRPGFSDVINKEVDYRNILEKKIIT